MKGSVKQIVETVYHIDTVPGMFIQRLVSREIEKFNSEGYLVEEMRSETSDTTILRTTRYAYDGNKRLYGLEDGTTDTTFYFFYPDGNIREIFIPNGTIGIKRQYFYDKEGKLTLEQHIGPKLDTFFTLRQYTDAARKKVRRYSTMTFRNDSGETAYSNSYTYINGLLAVDSSWTNGKFTGANKYDYSHDKYENCTREKRGSGYPLTMEYVYDTQENWTQKKKFRNRELYEIVYREIEYY